MLMALIVLALPLVPPAFMAWLLVADELEWREFKKKTGIR